MRSDLPALSRSAVDRDAAARADPDLLPALAVNPRTRLVLVHRGRVAVTADGSALDLRTPGRPARREDAAAADSPRAPRPLAYLGRDREARYLACVAVEGEAAEPDVAGVSLAEPEGGGARWAGLREVGHLLGDRDAGLAVTAVALEAWHDRHGRCPRCGEPTVADQAGWTRRCPADGSEHYPRTDPAVIVAVTDDADRLLLAHARRWPAGRYSLIAGFVEPGESLEAAVRREVREECAVEVAGLSYVSSQPWPFPASLMVGFRAVLAGGRLRADDDEITDARFVERQELADLVRAGRLLLPSRASIARTMVEEWFGGPIDAE